MKIILLAIVIILMSCGQKTQFQINGFENYYSSFVANTNHSSNNLIIQFGDLWAQNYMGLCTIGGQTPIVTIDKTFWYSVSEDDRQEIIDHELGHCILGRVHKDDLLSNGIPSSIMHTTHFDPNIIKLNKVYYYKELIQ